jgi:hypothetical protein
METDLIIPRINLTSPSENVESLTILTRKVSKTRKFGGLPCQEKQL